MGGLTTHSTYIVEVVRLQQHGRALLAPAYLFGSLAAGIAAAAIGLLLGGRVGRTLRTLRTLHARQTRPTRRRPRPQGSSSLSPVGVGGARRGRRPGRTRALHRGCSRQRGRRPTPGVRSTGRTRRGTRWAAAIPLGTIAVNLTACFLLGLLTGLAASGPSQLRTVAGTGFLGGYSTFSTASLEGARLLLDGRGGAALAHALAMTAGALAMALIGAGLGSALARIG